MENRKTFINFWSDFLHQKGLSNYQSVKTAIIFADQIEELHSQLSGSNAGNVYEIIEDLVDAIPKQDDDHDWWPDDLTDAIEKAKKWLDTTPIPPIKSNDVGDCEHEIVFIDSKDPFCWKCKKYEKDIQKSVDVGDVENANEVGVELTFNNGDYDSFQINCLDEDNEMPVCVRSNSKKTKYDLSISEATELVKFISYHIKNENPEWQKQQPINPITIEKIIRMVKNSSPEIKKLVMDELGVEQKEPVSDAIEFAEWAYDKDWIIQPNKNWWNFHADIKDQVEIPTTELYEIYLQSIQLNK
jgi:hypothetical protein